MFRRAGKPEALLAAVLLVACADRRRPPPPQRSTVELSLEHLPAETSAVIQLDASRLAKSPLVRRAVAALSARDAASADRLKDFFSRCQIDVEKDLGKLVVVLGPPGPQQDAALLVRGQLDEKRLVACVAETTQEDRHQVPVYKTADEPPVFFAFAAPGSLVAATSVAWIDQFLDPRAPRLAPTAPLAKLIASESAKDATAWGAGILPAGVGERIVALTEGDVTRPAQAVTFRLDADAGLSLRVALEMATEADAEKLVAFAEDQRGWLAIVAGRYGVEELVRQFVMSRPEGSRQAVLEARVEPALVEQVAALLGRAEIR
jgi:hypothetical protein